MLDIWEPLETESTNAVLLALETETGEALEQDKTQLLVCVLRPYEHHFLVKVVLKSQWVVNKRNDSRKFGIAGNSHSFLLVRFYEDGSVQQVVPLESKSNDLYCFNKLVDFRVNSENAADYMTVYGQIVQANGYTFDFLQNIAQLNQTIDKLPEDSKDQFINGVKTIVDVDSKGCIDLQQSMKSYRFLGKVYKMTFPTIYSGELYKAEIRLSDRGYPTMDNDSQTTIRGLDLVNRPTDYYSLDKPQEIMRRFHETMKSNQRSINFIVWPQLLEKFLGFVLIPAALLMMGITFYFGFEDQIVFQFFEKLPAISMLNVLCLILGTIMTAVGFIRFGIIHAGSFLSSLVPNRFTLFYDSLTTQLTNQQRKLGSLVFAIMLFSEIVLIAGLALTLFVYGFLNVFGAAPINFIEALVFVVTSFPVALSFIEGFKLGEYNVPSSLILARGVLFFISTVVIGFVWKVIQLVRK